MLANARLSPTCRPTHRPSDTVHVLTFTPLVRVPGSSYSGSAADISIYTFTLLLTYLQAFTKPHYF
jgi:hypothetical protein